MAFQVTIATNGLGIPVTESTIGAPANVALNGAGVPVVVVASGGVPLNFNGLTLPGPGSAQDFFLPGDQGVFFDMDNAASYTESSGVLTGLVDLSGNGNDVPATGTPALAVLNGVNQFDANPSNSAGIAITDGWLQSFQNELTVAIIATPNGVAGSSGVAWGSSNNLIEIREITNQVPKVPVNIGRISNKPYASVGTATATTGPDFVDGETALITHQISATTVKTYFNGVLTDTIAVSGDREVPAGRSVSLRIGARSNNSANPANYWDGKVGSLFLIDRTMTDQEVTDLNAILMAGIAN